MELEERDWRLLEQLQTDARLTNQELSDRVGMSPSACWRRVRQLEEAGIVTGYRASVDVRRAGMSFHAILHVQLTRHTREVVDRFIAEVMRHEEVLDCFATTGQADYHLRILCRDLDAFNAFMERTLFRLDGIANIQTNLVLRHVKSGTVIRG